jgi:cell division septal protein FtsQ
MKKAFAIIPSLVVLLVTLVVGVYFALGKRLLVEKVTVVMAGESKEQLLFEEIKKDLNQETKDLIGASMLQLSFPTLVDEILKDKRVKSVQVRREFPGAVIVRIEPREPVLGWVDERGFLRPVAKDNEIMPRLKSGLLRDVAILRGKEFSKDSKLRLAAIELIESLPTEGYFQRSMISEIRHSKASGFDLVLTEPSVIVKIGRENYQERSKRLEKVLSYIHNRDIKGRVIDSRFDKKVVVRLRNEP